jgi:hypothetical protein
MRDTDPADPFDGVNTHATFCSSLPCSSWITSSPNTEYDLYMILQEKDPVSGGGTKPQFVSGSPSHVPLNPTTGQTITLSATATDDIGITKIELYTGTPPGTLVKTCTISPTSPNPPACTQTIGPYSTTRTVNYYAIAYESPTSSTTSATKSFTVTLDTGGSCPSIPWDNMPGVNFRDPILSKSEFSTSSSTDFAFVDTYLPEAKNTIGAKVIRVPMYWESYVGNRDRFINQAKYIAQWAKNNQVYVIFDNHHFDGSNQWGPTATDSKKVAANGLGFPSTLVRIYSAHTATPVDYEDNPKVFEFWDDFYKNKVNGLPTSGEGSAWDLNADYMVDVINQLEATPNCYILGYEILNEPHIWELSDYDDLGAYHTYIAQRIRADTGSQKYLFFTRETTHGGMLRSTDREYKILPRDPLKKVAYWPHIYAVPGATDSFNGGSLGNANTQITNLKEAIECWESTGVCVNPYDTGTGTKCSTQTCANKVTMNLPPMGFGEWATQDNQICWQDLQNSATGVPLMEAFVCKWMKEGSPHTYWAFAGFGMNEGNVLIKSDKSLTIYGQRYKDAIAKYYPPNILTCPVPNVRGPYDEGTSGPAIDPDTGCPKPP